MLSIEATPVVCRGVCMCVCVLVTDQNKQKRLKGHRHIVTYIDSHASHLKGGGYEVFLLMEYCSGWYKAGF